MGFFEDLAKVRALADSPSLQVDVKSRLAQAQERMDQMNAAFAPLPDDPASEARRVSATATIVSARQTGAMVNFNPAIELDLLVLLPGGIPLPVTRTEVVAQLNLSRLMTGAKLNVTLDPQVPASLRVDWTAS